MIYDICTFNGESELFSIRYEILKDYVDEFRVIEFDKTFSGKEKHAVFNQNWPKVKSYYVTEPTWSKYEDLAKSSPNTEYGKGASHWIREFMQKESIKDCLTDLKDDDQVYIGDCDEIWNPRVLKEHLLGWINPVWKLKLEVYSYYLNNKSNEEFWGTIYTKYRCIKDKCLNHLRSIDLMTFSVEDDLKKEHHCKTNISHGWHFTSIGGYENVKKKLTDSYTEESYASQYVLDNLYDNINGIHDFLGRDFNYSKDDSDWPDYLRNNKAKYNHLLRP